MTKNLVYFAHGKESGPWGIKIQRLAEAAESLGFEVESPDYSGMMEPEPRVEKLLSLNPEASETLVLVGSSMGAWVSIKASEKLKPKGLFLLAPAVHVGVYSEEAPTPYASQTEIVHGWNDDVVPVENAIRFARDHQSELHLLKSDHRLNDHLDQLDFLFSQFLVRLTEKPKENRSKWELEQEANFQKTTFENQKPRIPR